MTPHLLLTIMGFAGGFAVLASYAGTATERLSPTSLVYHALNLGGAALVAVSSFATGAWPSVGVNVIWAGISAYGLCMAARQAVAFAV